jgi:signal peptidase II
MAGGAGRRLALLLAMAGTIGCDRLTKHVAGDMLAGTPGQSLLGGSVRLEYAENPGAFLGFGAGWPPQVRMTIFVAATVVGLFVMARLARRLRHAPGALFGLALIAGGALSNMSDRLAYGSVVDFIHVGVGPVRTGIFNVADVAIMAGAALLIAAIAAPGNQPAASPPPS